MKLISTLFFLFLAMNCYADSNFFASQSSTQIEISSKLGDIEIDGLGTVSLTAQKNGKQLVVHAQGPDGEVIGKAETVVGLNDTPIYVMTPDGLQKITVFWGAE